MPFNDRGLGRQNPTGKVGYYNTSSLDGHVKLIAQQFRKSLTDPETVRLAGKIVSGAGDWVSDPKSGKRVQVVQAWDKLYRMPNKPDVGRIRADDVDLARIWNFAILNVRYVLDTDGVDTFSTVKETLEQARGDCDDFSILICALATAVGFQTAVRVLSTDGRAWEHVFPLVAVPKEGSNKKWIALDPTVEGKKLGWSYQERGAVFRDFAMSMT